jgi:4-hydroxy-tetrahydrodipicolinate synthase
MTQASSSISALNGVSGILVTPYDTDGRINPYALDPIIARAAKAGIEALTINGNTSEFYSLSFEEARAMQAQVPSLINRRAFVTAGVGRSLTEACQLARSARADGVDALMIHQPPDPFRAPRGVLDYAARVAEAGDGLPIVLYLRDDSGGMDFIDKLCKIPNVVGVKWATPNVMVLAQAIRHFPQVSWICGLAEPWAPPMAAVGARGFTSGIINVAPHLSQGVLEALRANDYQKAGAIIARLEPFERFRATEGNGANVSVVKQALMMQGHAVGPARSPAAWPLSDEVQNGIRAVLKEWGAL